MIPTDSLGHAESVDVDFENLNWKLQCFLNALMNQRHALKVPKKTLKKI